jgi:hypothetical protein
MSAKVTFQVTTYYKRPKGEPGITRAGSVRLSLGDALDWILDEAPDEAVTVDHDLNTDKATVVIDWSKVPDDIRYGTMS